MRSRVYIFLIILVLMIGIDAEAKNLIKVKLVKCVDGDTAIFKVGKEERKVRFLAINTPESTPESQEEPFGKEASKYTCKKLTNAKSIKLEYDPKSSETDNYGRLLAWVYVDDKLLQEDLVSKGYAEVKYIYANYLYVDSLKEKEEKAKNKKLRIWSDEAIQEREIKNSQNTEKNEEFDNDQIFDALTEILDKITRKLVKRLKSML